MKSFLEMSYQTHPHIILNKNKDVSCKAKFHSISRQHWQGLILQNNIKILCYLVHFLTSKGRNHLLKIYTIYYYYYFNKRKSMVLISFQVEVDFTSFWRLVEMLSDLNRTCKNELLWLDGDDLFRYLSQSVFQLRGHLVSSLECDFKECDFRELKSRESDFVIFGISGKC